MAYSCYMGNPGVKVGEEVKDSKLWNDLRKGICKSVLETNRVYSIFASDTVKNFLLSEVGGFNTDENGELILEELISNDIISNNNKGLFNIEESRLKEMAEKDLDLNSQNLFVEACRFNHNSPFRYTYFATVIYNSKGHPKLELISLKDKTETEVVQLQKNLQEIIQKEEAITRCQTFLASKGFKIKVNQNTVGAVETLVDYADSDDYQTDTPEDAQQKVGELLWEITFNTPFFVRLQNQMTDEVLRALGYDFDETTKPQVVKQAMVDLLGKTYCNKVKEITPVEKTTTFISNAINRLKEMLKKVCSFIKRSFNNSSDYVRQLIKDAEEYATQIVFQEISPDKIVEDNYRQANNKDIFRPLTLEDKQLAHIVSFLNTQAQNLSQINELMGIEINNIISDIEKQKLSLDKKVEKTGNVFYTDAVTTIIINACTRVADLFKNDGLFATSLELWNSMIKNSSLLELDMAAASKSLRGLSIAVESCEYINTIINNSIVFLNQLKNENGMKESTTKAINALTQARNCLTEILYTKVGAKTLMDQAKLQFGIKFLEGVYGATFINRTARKAFQRTGRFPFFTIKSVQDTPVKLNEKGIPVDKYGNEINSLSQFINNTSGPMGFCERFIFSASNSGDMITQALDDVMKRQKQVRNRMAYNIQIELVELRDEAVKIGLYKSRDAMSKLFETYKESNEKTGNYISELNYGEWERDKDNFIRQIWEDFNTSSEADTDDKILKNIKWQAYKELRLKNEFHKENSFFDQNTKRWRPKKYQDKTHGVFSKYYNPKYAELSQEERQFLKKILDLKQRIDTENLPKGATIPLRVPQFRGDFIDRIKGRHQQQGAPTTKQKIENTIKNMWSEIKIVGDEFSKTAVWDDYGSDLEYEESTLSDSFYESTSTKMKRIPLYGINKRHRYVTLEDGSVQRTTDMSELSTDIIGSLYAYSMMAVQYSSLNQIIDAMEIVYDRSEERMVNQDGKVEMEKTRRTDSENKKRMAALLERQLYGKRYQNAGRTSIPMAKFANSLGSMLALGWNFLGGIVNRGTGNNEMNIEAMAGEFFNKKDLFKARTEWVLHKRTILKNPFRRTTMSPKDKVSAFAKYFDVHNKEFEQSTHWSTRKRRFLDTSLSEWAMFPYSSGEHYMQCVTFMACMNHVKVWKMKDGRYQKMSLYDAYETQKISNNEDTILTLGGEIVYQDFEGNPAKLEEAQKDVPKLKALHKLREDYDQMVNERIAENQPIENISDFKQYVTDRDSSLSYLFDKYGLVTEITNPADPNGEKIPTSSKMFIQQINNTLSEYIVDLNFEMKIREQAQEISNRCHGVYNNEDASELSNYLLGQLILSMKGWAIGQATKMFKPHSYNTILKREDEGYIRTYARHLLSMGKTAKGKNRWTLRDNETDLSFFEKTLGKAAIGVTSLSPLTVFFSDYLPFIGVVNCLLPNSFYKKWGFADYEIANMRRLHAKIMITKLMYLVTQMLFSAYDAIPDDDEDEEKDPNKKREKAQKEEEFRKELENTSVFNPKYYFQMLMHFDKIKIAKTLVGAMSYISMRMWHEQHGLNPLLALGRNSWESLVSLIPIALNVLFDIAPFVKQMIQTEFKENADPQTMAFYNFKKSQKHSAYYMALKKYKQDPVTGFTFTEYVQYNHMLQQINSVLRKAKEAGNYDFEELLKIYVEQPLSPKVTNNKNFIQFLKDNNYNSDNARMDIKKAFDIELQEENYNAMHDLCIELYYVDDSKESSNAKGFKVYRKMQSKPLTKIAQKTVIRTPRQLLDIQNTIKNYRHFTEGGETPNLLQAQFEQHWIDKNLPGLRNISPSIQENIESKVPKLYEMSNYMYNKITK